MVCINGFSSISWKYYTTPSDGKVCCNRDTQLKTETLARRCFNGEAVTNIQSFDYCAGCATTKSKYFFRENISKRDCKLHGSVLESLMQARADEIVKIDFVSFDEANHILNCVTTAGGNGYIKQMRCTQCIDSENCTKLH